MNGSFGDRFNYDAMLRIEAASSEDYDSLRDRLFVAPLMDHIVGLRAQGCLPRIKGSGNRKGHFLEAWNEFVTGQSDQDEWIIANFMAEAFMAPLSHVFLRTVIAKIDEDTARQEAWREIVRRIDDGHLPLRGEDGLFPTPPSRTKCESTGTTMVVGMRDWSPTLYDFLTGEEVEDLDPPAIQHLTVEIERGMLLVADHFRIEAFSKAVDGIEADPNGASSVAGRERMTRDYLERLGMVSVSVSNSSPFVFLRDGVIAIGAVDTDVDDWQDARAFEETALGRTCTDLWWVTMIERHRLVDIVARDAPSRDEAERIVEDYVREHDDVTEVDVPPGTYHLYFSGDDENRDKIFTTDVDLGRMETMFVLSPRELNLLDERQPSMEAAGPRPG